MGGRGGGGLSFTSLRGKRGGGGFSRGGRGIGLAGGEGWRGGVSSRTRGGRGGALLSGTGGGGGFPYPRDLGGSIGPDDPLFVSEGDKGTEGNSVRLVALFGGLGGRGGVLVPEPGIEPFLLSRVPLMEEALAAPSGVKGEGELGALPGPGEFSSPSCSPSLAVFTGAWALLRRPISVPINAPLESGGFSSNLYFLGYIHKK